MLFADHLNIDLAARAVFLTLVLNFKFIQIFMNGICISQRVIIFPITGKILEILPKKK
jgi:hypothetical protein